MREPATSTEAEILKNTSNGVFRNFRTDIVNKRCGDSRINECYNVLTEAKSACAKAQALRSKRRFESSHFDQSNRRQAVFLLRTDASCCLAILFAQRQKNLLHIKTALTTSIFINGIIIAAKKRLNRLCDKKCSPLSI